MTFETDGLKVTYFQGVETKRFQHGVKQAHFNLHTPYRQVTFSFMLERGVPPDVAWQRLHPSHPRTVVSFHNHANANRVPFVPLKEFVSPPSSLHPVVPERLPYNNRNRTTA